MEGGEGSTGEEGEGGDGGGGSGRGGGEEAEGEGFVAEELSDGRVVDWLFYTTTRRRRIYILDCLKRPIPFLGSYRSETPKLCMIHYDKN